jgi:hypothetical protein
VVVVVMVERLRLLGVQVLVGFPIQGAVEVVLGQ